MRYEIIQNLEDSTFEIKKTRSKNSVGFRKSRTAKKYLNLHLRFLEDLYLLAEEVDHAPNRF